jgi:hypothetical protein
MLRILGLFLICMLIAPLSMMATHMRAGNILVRKIGDCNSLLYQITIVAYIDTESPVPFGGATTDLLYIRGTSGPPVSFVVPEITKNNVPPGCTYTVIDEVLKVARVTYTTQVVFRGNDTYTISYTEINRNAGILNMYNSVETPFYIETQILIDQAGLGCSTPALISVPPVDQACSGVTWTHNPGATDPDDSISYELAIPYSAPRREVVDHKFPNHPIFYSDYPHGNEAQDGEPKFTIDPIDGTITWDAPDAPGEYNIAFHIVEWRKDKSGKRRRIGYVRRDMQIIVKDDCDNERPELNVPQDICVRAGESIDEVITAFDKPNSKGEVDKVRIEAFSQLFELTAPSIAATKTPANGSFEIAPQMAFHWQTTCADVREQPYLVVFKATDDNDYTRLATFKTWRIRVVGPEPVWNDRISNPSSQSVTLKWNSYICNNAQTMQIWRRVDSLAYTPGECETGMPPTLGYEKIADVSASQTQYVDTNNGEGLSSAARYCYRLVAVFPSPKGGESIVSSDTCIMPIETPDPVITNVSVLKTDPATGKVKVKWRKPFKEQFPLPYTYRVYRGNGFERSDSVLVKTIENSLNEYDSIEDDAAGLNTENNVYNYSVVVYKNNTDLPTQGFGFSKPASTVRLTTRAQVGKIILSWSADVPWSNVMAGAGGKYNHKIYRGPEGSTDDELIAEIASVDVTQEGLTYTDEGPLEEGTIYCYRVETYGSYGNADLIDPLINRSQKLCARPGDSIPPICNMVVEVDAQDCKGLIEAGQLCNANVFTNTITWQRPDDPNCDDIAEYIIYRSGRKGGAYVRYDSVPSTSTSFTDRNLISFAQCYKIQAKDHSGNVGPLSEEVCKDNCPYYAIPNVFTPNGDGKNDVLNAYDARRFCNENGECSGVPDIILQNCPRFVEAVKFSVINRWGQEVYNYKSDNTSERTIYIDWNGKDNSGVLLASGVYYYNLEVTFDSVDPKNNVKHYKGWLHIIHEAD